MMMIESHAKQMSLQLDLAYEEGPKRKPSWQGYGTFTDLYKVAPNYTG